ncbi:YdcF family protein [Halostreptopolyspora alba]|uniref:YdcF family protein n=1 Tax=Halostreptopolyspora alba TaxID=2487137 RepID=A0A3N0EGV5_9ACTN|nr:YdcF family protein [Nocardiopsaceae bacterium YIM 96095]
MAATIDDEVHALAQRLWDFHTAPAAHSPPTPGEHDIILALGSHDLRVAEHAAHLWDAGAAPLIVLSGQRGRRTAGAHGHDRWPRPEAEEFAQTARATAGIPSTAMLLETHATNTAENFTHSRALTAAHGIAVTRAIVTAKPYMGQRALATATAHWPEARWTFHCFAGGYTDYPNADTPTEELVHFLVGDTQRLDVYARRRWSSPVDIPDDVWRAYELLVARGFTNHLVDNDTTSHPRPTGRSVP